MKILQVLNPKSLHSDWDRLGDTSLTFNLLEGFSLLDREDVEITILANLSGYRKEEFYKDYPYNNLSVEKIPEYIPLKHTYQSEYFKYISEYVRSNSIDIVHFQQAQSSAAYYIDEFLKENPDVGVVFTIHTPPEVRTIQMTYRENFLNILSNPRGYLIAVSSHMKQRILNALGLSEEDPRASHVYVVKNSVKSVPESVKTSKYSDKSYKFISVGRIDPLKATLETLKFYDYYTTKCECRALFIGDSVKSTYKQDSPYVTECIDILRSNDHIDWIHHCDRDTVYSEMAKSEYYMSLSMVETFSLTSCESLSVGTPVIGFDVGGVGELLKDRVNGISIPKVKCRKMTSYYNDIESRLSENPVFDPEIVRSSVKDLTSVNLAKNYLTLYEEIINHE